MKMLPKLLLLPAALLFAAPSHAVAPAPTVAPAKAPAPAPVIPGAQSPSFGQGHEGHAHVPTLEESHEEREKVEAANKLTERKLKGLAVFTREQARAVPFREALAKAKLERAQADELSFLTESYYPARLAARQAEKKLAATRGRLEAAKTAKQEPAREDVSQEIVLSRQLQDHDRFRHSFVGKLSEGSRALIERFEDEFVTIVAEREQLAQKRAEEARAAALVGLDEERLARFLVVLQESAKKKPDAKALELAKLEPKQFEGLSLLLADYYNKKIAMDADEKALAETRTRLSAARAEKKPAAFDERLERYYVEKLEVFQAFRTDYAGKYGVKLVELLDKRSAEFVDAYKKHHAAVNPPEEQ